MVKMIAPNNKMRDEDAVEDYKIKLNTLQLYYPFQAKLFNILLPLMQSTWSSFVVLEYKIIYRIF